MNSDEIFEIVRFESIKTHSQITEITELNSLENEEGENLLHACIAYGNVSWVSPLLKNGINPNKKTKIGTTPLHYTTQRQDTGTTELLLKHDADPNIQDSHGNSPLWTAVFNARGNYEVTELLLNSGGDPTSINKYNKSPIDFAISIKDQKLINLLNKYRN